MQSIRKKILTGTMAATILLGGGIVGTHVFAATPGTAADQQADGSVKHDKYFGHGKHHGFDHRSGGMFLQETAKILGLNQKDLFSELKQGKSLADIAQEKAGLTEDALLQKLTDAANQKIDAALSAGKITQEQADKQKSTLADRLKKAVEHKGIQKFEHEKGHFVPWANPESLAKILGITQEQLKSDLKAGKSLSEIAQEKGINEEQLINSLKDSMTDKLKKFVESKRTPHGDKSKMDAPNETSSAQ